MSFVEQIMSAGHFESRGTFETNCARAKKGISEKFLCSFFTETELSMGETILLLNIVTENVNPGDQSTSERSTHTSDLINMLRAKLAKGCSYCIHLVV